VMARDRPLGTVANGARLWTVVLLATVAGVIVTRGGIALPPALPPEVHRAFSAIAGAAFAHGFGTTLMRGVFAGYLIAVMVWLLPGAGAARLWIVVLLTYLVGLGEFASVIAGSGGCASPVSRGRVT